MTCPASVIYTGLALTPCSVSITGAGGLSLPATPSYTNNINPGMATASYTYAGDANHYGSSGSKTFQILYSSEPCLGSPGRDVLQPINRDAASTTSAFKKGSTVPVKFRVCDFYGHSIGTAGVVTSFELVKKLNGTGSEELVTEDIVSTTPDTAFRWSSTDQQWIFNLNTKNLAVGYTYYYEIGLGDGGPPIAFHVYLAK